MFRETDEGNRGHSTFRAEHPEIAGTGPGVKKLSGDGVSVGAVEAGAAGTARTTFAGTLSGAGGRE